MIWNLIWIWVGIASALTVVSVWRHMSPKWLGTPVTKKSPEGLHPGITMTER
jgi:hypothetical protein